MAKHIHYVSATNCQRVQDTHIARQSLPKPCHWQSFSANGEALFLNFWWRFQMNWYLTAGNNNHKFHHRCYEVSARLTVMDNDEGQRHGRKILAPLCAPLDHKSAGNLSNSPLSLHANLSNMFRYRYRSYPECSYFSPDNGTGITDNCFV